MEPLGSLPYCNSESECKYKWKYRAKGKEYFIVRCTYAGKCSCQTNRVVREDVLRYDTALSKMWRVNGESKQVEL